jgi:thymidylate synthase
MIHQSFKTFQEAFLGINKTIIEDPTFVSDSRLGYMNEIPGFAYSVEDLSSYIFPNPEIGKLDYNYANLFYEWMIGGCTDNSTILEQYPNTAKFMEKPKSQDLPDNFNTFYGPRILEQLPSVINELKENPTTRRAVISILEKNDLQLLDKDESLEFPCCDSATFFIREGKLNVHLHMRSQNMGQVLKLDMYLWARFTCELANKLEIKPGTFISSIVSAHVFKRDINYLTELIDNNK